MNYEKRELVFDKVTHYVRTRTKAVRFDVPPNLHRPLDLRRAWRQLTQDGFRPKAAWQSEVLAERYDATAPLMTRTVKTEDIWDLVYSDDWADCSSLRICDGELLQRIVEQLFLLVESGKITTFKVAKFDRCALVTEGGILMNGSTQSSAPTPEDVKVTFTYYAVNLGGNEGKTCRVAPSGSYSSQSSASTNSDATLDSALQPSAECVLATSEGGRPSPINLHRCQSVPNAALPPLKCALTSEEYQQSRPAPRGRRLSVVRSVNVFGALITISTASSTELDTNKDIGAGGSDMFGSKNNINQVPLPSITVAPLSAKSLQLMEGKALGQTASKTSKSRLGLRSRGNLTSKYSGLSPSRVGKSKLVFRPSFEEMETQVVSFVDNRIVNRNDDEVKATSREGTPCTPPGYYRAMHRPSQMQTPSSGRSSAPTPPGQEVNVWCRSPIPNLPSTCIVKSATNDLVPPTAVIAKSATNAIVRRSMSFNPITMSVFHCSGHPGRQSAPTVQPADQPQFRAPVHPLEEAGLRTYCLTAPDEHLLVPDVPPDPLPEARAAARRALHHARFGHATSPLTEPIKAITKGSLRDFLQSRPCTRLDNSLGPTTESGLATQLVRPLVFGSTPLQHASRNASTECTSSTTNPPEPPAPPIQLLDTTRVNRRYSLDCLRRERLRQRQERPPPISLGRRLQKEAIKQFLEKKLGGQQGAPPPKKEPRTRRLSTMVPPTTQFLAPRHRPPTPPPLPPIPNPPAGGKLARAKLLSAPPDKPVGSHAWSAGPGHRRPVWAEPLDMEDFQERLLQALNEFVIRKEVVTRDSGRRPIVTLTINRPINYRYE